MAGPFFPTLRRFLRLRKTPLWKVAEDAVVHIAADLTLQRAASVEDRVSYCPRCGQRPSGDRRFEEARERVFEKLDPLAVRRSDVDFALAFHYWRRKDS